jgi:hypothetical protein
MFGMSHSNFFTVAGNGGMKVAINAIKLSLRSGQARL